MSHFFKLVSAALSVASNHLLLEETSSFQLNAALSRNGSCPSLHLALKEVCLFICFYMFVPPKKQTKFVCTVCTKLFTL